MHRWRGIFRLGDPREGFLDRIEKERVRCKQQQESRIMNIFDKLTNFLREVYSEMKKVSWPSRQETVKYTLIVIGVSLAVAFFLGGLDFIFTWVLDKFILR